MWQRDWKQNWGCIKGDWINENRNPGSRKKTEQECKIEGIQCNYGASYIIIRLWKLDSTETGGEQGTGNGDEVLEENGETDEAR